MRTDRELLELAAKVAGMQVLREGVEWPRENIGWFFCVQHGIPALHDRASSQVWKPIHDDGDALRLAVKLHIDVYQSRIYDESCAVSALEKPHSQLRGDDPYAATRRAIVRAAAEIGAQVSPPALNTDKEGEHPTNNKGESNGQV
jgi:hypothetical protein